MADAPRPEPKPEPKPEQRIAKLLARAGVASRREVERMIAEGRVALDGKPLDTPATLLRSLRGVTVDGQPVAAPAPARLFLFHKPPGLLTTERDPAGRPTIYDRLPSDLPRLVPVGRLDLATEGLLLMTTDGGLKRQLELPATGVERAYRARAFGEVSQAQLEELIEGVEIDGVRYGSIDANLERRTGANVWVELILTEGKNREVRRVLEHLGLQVSRLLRTRYGPFVLGDLQPGEIGEVRQHDLVAFRRQLEKKQKPDAAIGVAPLPPPRALPAEAKAVGGRAGANGGADAERRAPRPGRPRRAAEADPPAQAANRRARPPGARAADASGAASRDDRGTTRRARPAPEQARAGRGRGDRAPAQGGKATADGRERRPGTGRPPRRAADGETAAPPRRAVRPPRRAKPDDLSDLTTSRRPPRGPARPTRPTGLVPPRGPRRPPKR